jgi:hypothetical protein
MLKNILIGGSMAIAVLAMSAISANAQKLPGRKRVAEMEREDISLVRENGDGVQPMAILRYIDAEGREQDVDDVNHLFELIQERRVSFDSLVWDDEQRRWVAASDHEFFRRIREIAAASPTPPQPWSAPPPRQPTPAVKPAPQIYKSPLMQHRNPAPEGAAAASASKKPKSNWFKAINTREEALKTIKDSSSAFFFVAAVQAAIGIWLATQYPNAGFDVGETMIDVAIYAVPNSGGWYDFGYFLGIVVFGVGARKGHTVYRDRVVHVPIKNVSPFRDSQE